MSHIWIFDKLTAAELNEAVRGCHSCVVTDPWPKEVSPEATNIKAWGVGRRLEPQVFAATNPVAEGDE